MFTNAQRIKVYARLGFAPRYLGLDTRVEAAIAALGQDPDAQALVEAYLADLDKVDAALVAARARQKFGSLLNDKLVFAGYRELAALRSEGRRVVGQLASLLGVSARHDVYASSSSVDTGPALTPLMGPDGGGGNGMKIG